MNKAIDITDLQVNGYGHTLLQDVTISIPKGSFTYIVGANGSGKTTLVKAILGLIPVSKGEIKILGSSLSKKVVANNIGYVPQYNNIDRGFPITVREVIELACIQGPACPTDPVGHLALFDAQDVVDRSLEKLSGGEFQKVLIARALVNNPEIVILDEPVNNLDIKSQEALLDRLKHLHTEQNKTVIVISHDHHLIKPDESVLLVADKGVKESSAKEVLHMEHS